MESVVIAEAMNTMKNVQNLPMVAEGTVNNGGMAQTNSAAVTNMGELAGIA